MGEEQRQGRAKPSGVLTLHRHLGHDSCSWSSAARLARGESHKKISAGYHSNAGRKLPNLKGEIPSTHGT